MRIAVPSHRVFFSNTVLAAVLLLSACVPPPPAPAPPPAVKHARPAAPSSLENTIQYRPDAYVLHLSLVKLMLESASSDMAAASADFDIARTYSFQQQPLQSLQPVIIIEYSEKSKKRHQRIAVPFSMPGDNDFPGLNEVMTQLGNMPYTLYDISVGVMNIHPQAPLESEGANLSYAQRIVEDRLQPLIAGASAPAPMLQARIELQLTRFFMSRRYKEPAYLAIENAKQSLATVDASTQNESDAVSALSREIESQEALLNKTMPFTLNF